MMSDAACTVFSHCRRTSKWRSHLSNPLLKMLGMSACFYHAFTVNSMQLSCFRVLQYIVHAYLSHTYKLLIFRPLGYWKLADGRFSTAKVLVEQCLDAYDLITICRFF